MEQLKDDTRRFGWMRALYMRLMGRLSALGLEVNYVMTRPLGEQMTGPFEIDGIEYRLADRDELILASANPELGMTAEFIDRAFANEDCCCAAFDGENLVSYAWRSGVGAPHVPGVRVALGDGCRYGYKAFTLSAYRGRGIYPKLSGLSDSEFVRRGKTRIVAFTATHNFASLAVDKKIGNRAIGLAGVLSIGSLCWVFHSPGVKRRGFSFVKDQRG